MHVCCAPTSNECMYAVDTSGQLMCTAASHQADGGSTGLLVYGLPTKISGRQGESNLYCEDKPESSQLAGVCRARDRGAAADEACAH